MATKKMEIETVTVTPAMCEVWLENNENNRPLRHRHIASLARAMTIGDWEFNGESIKIDPKGNVLDGQHRMWACMEAKTSFKSLVIKNVPAKAFDTIDTGETRSPSDIFSIRGISHVHVTVAALRYIGKYYAGMMMSSAKYTNREIEALYDQHSDLGEYVSKVSNGPRTRWCAGSVVVVGWYLASRKHKAKADEFFESFIHGTDLTADSVILTLRNKFIDVHASSTLTLSSPQKLELIINAWNLWRKGKTVKHFKTASLSTTSDAFPSAK